MSFADKISSLTAVPLDIFDLLSSIPFLVAIYAYWKSRGWVMDAKNPDYVGDKSELGKKAQKGLYACLVIFLIASISNSSMVIYNYSKNKPKDPLALSNARFARTSMLFTILFTVWFMFANKGLMSDMISPKRA